MIKDRVIQKRIKGKVLAMAMTAVMASFFVPLGAEAADLELGDASGGYLEFSAEGYRYTKDGTEAFTKCEENCTHTIKTKNKTSKYGISVTGGTHNIILDGVDIDTSKETDTNKWMSALSVSPNATANVTLKGTNKLVSVNTFAGISVPPDATLSIKRDEKDEAASLFAKSNYGGAGIGGSGEADNSSAGNITIYSGNITAIGGCGGAGIGGSGKGSAGNIVIHDGKVKAIGGGGNSEENPKKQLGAPGIGAGNESQENPYTSASGSITINGGDVTAWGGKHLSSGQADGMAAKSLESKKGATAIVVTNGFRANMNTDGFNGLRWSADNKGTSLPDGSPDIQRGNACTVYGHVTLPESLKNGIQIGETLFIDRGCSITIPTEWGSWVCKGKITGDGKIVNADLIRVDEGGFLDIADENLEVILQAKDFTITPNLTFKGEVFSDTEVYTIGDYREGANGKLYRINTDGWTRKYNFGLNGALTEEVKNAGKYTLVYSKAGCPTVSIDFEVTPCDIGKCTISPIEPVEYTGAKYGISEIKPYMTLGSYELTSGDYTCDFDQKGHNNTNAGEAKFLVVGKDNFTGEREVSYAIKKASITNTEDKKITEVTLLAQGSAVFTGGNYGQGVHKPESEKVIVSTLKTADKTLKKGTDYIVEYYRKDTKLTEDKPDDFKDAGEITVKIIGTGNFDGTVDAKYMINPIKLPVQSVVAESRKYNGTNEVNIKEITVDEASKDILDSDKGKVQADAKKLVGLIDLPNVGTYTAISFKGEGALLSGDRGQNYSIEGQTYQAPGILKEPVVISKGDAPQIELTGVQAVSETDANTFSYTLEATGKVDPDSGYWYCKTEAGAEPPSTESMKDPANSGIWDRNNVFDKNEPAKTYVFYAFADGTPNIEMSLLAVDTHPFERLPRESGPQTGGTLTINEKSNEELDIEPYDEAFTATISDPPGDNGPFLYSFDGGKTYGPENVKRDCQPGESYTAYIKYAESTVYLENEDSQGTPGNTVDAPTLKAKTPVITTSEGLENGGTFGGRTNVIINYPGRATDMTIYYTTDGTRPGRDSEQLVAGESFPISATTTVKAIASKGSMEDSDVAEATFTAAEATEVTEANVSGLTDDKIPSSLKIQLEEGEDPISDAESLKAYLNKRLRTLNTGYEYDNVAYYDLIVQIKSYREGSTTPTIVPATEDDFPRKVRLKFDQLRSAEEKFPDLTGEVKYDLVAVHMFSGDFAPKFPAGQIENITSITQGEDYIEFEVSGASPLAIGWKVATNTNPDDPNNPNNPDDPNNPDNPDDPNNPDNPDDPNNPDDPTNPDDPNNPDNQDPNANGDGTGNQNGDGTNRNGTTSSTNAAEQGASDDSKSALSNLMPKTGDPISFIPWIAAAVVSIGVIVGIVKKKNGKKKKPNKTTKKTTQKSTQKTKKKK